MAGIEAVKLLRKRTNFNHHWEARSDIERAHSIASQLGHKQETDRYFAVAKAAVEASNILKSKQETLALLARALIENSELPGEEVIRLIETARA